MSRPTPSQNVSFQDTTPPSRRAGRNEQQPPRPPPKNLPSKSSLTTTVSEASAEAYNTQSLGYDSGGYVEVDPEGFSANNGADVRRKKSMVRPERERIDPNHRLWHYREHAAEDQVDVQPSSTGNQPYNQRTGGANLRRGKSLLARDTEDVDHQSGLNIFKRGATIRRRASQAASRGPPSGAQSNRAGAGSSAPEEKVGCLGNFAPGPKDAWMVYCYLLTFCVPGFVLRNVFGRRTPDAERAWREKIGLVSIVASLMTCVGYLTFGFTQTVCGTQSLRIAGGQANNGSLIINGYDYDFSTWRHPAVSGTEFNGSTSPLYTDDWMAGGKDASFLFQNVNKHCLGIITPATGTGITVSGEQMAWYFPCNLHDQNGTSALNLTGYADSTNCHTSSTARSQFAAIAPTAEIYYTWPRVYDTSRNLAVYKSAVIDMSLLQWLDDSQVSYPAFFDTIKNRNETYAGQDITALIERSGLTDYAKCLTDVIQVGFVDSITIGCVASDIVLYVSLVFILGAVMIKFGMAVVFGWFLSWRLGNFKGESYQERMKRAAEIENWTDDIYKAAPGYLRPNATGRGNNGGGARKTVFLPTTSRFSKAEPMLVSSSRPTTAYGMAGDNRRQASSVYGNKLGPNVHTTPPGSPMLRNSRSSTSLPFRDESHQSLSDQSVSNPTNCPFPLGNVVPQPAPDFEPFQFPLVHTICLVTAYSESVEGLRTTLDSLATTDYPNSHKLILVIADGMVRGSGSKQYTPDIVLTMMKELVTPADEVEAHSYVAIADGHKRHNMAKVYAGFYSYDNETVEISKQQRVPMVLVAKTGNPLEANDAKPGNRGKRDSQIVLMSFLQKVMFDERMTTFDYEFFNSIWRCTGVQPDRYETVLCVDADTKVFPDSLTRMNACMVNDHEIMGLCGETKIANKSETWVTMIQGEFASKRSWLMKVFEYYISHHNTKAFESVFGGVTCLPGCFSMYRIKAPKGDRGYWVPILANPDICEHYSENVVDTLHKKNLLLLGEDRYLSTLMLKTFPKRKMVFCPQAVCKTVVPDTFRVLLSQRRRWINSTVHNLFELMLVRDLCGTFCFSMQFVVFMDLVGTLVLPAAISFTLYIIVISIIPQSVTGMPRPIISLILLAFILGLPGVLIVITSRKVAYVGWMLIYLLSLPVWNLILPAYAYWHMDDFTWGETRKIAGETKEEAHGGKEGVFDSRHIVMKRWVEFERERRWRNGTSSRDSQYYDVVQRGSSPKGGIPSNRYSVVSTETFHSNNNGTNEGNPNNPLFRQSQSYQSINQFAPSPEAMSGNISQLALPPTRGAYASGSSSNESGSSNALERGPSDDPSNYGHAGAYNNYQSYPNENYQDDAEQPILSSNYIPHPTSPEPTYGQPATTLARAMYAEPDDAHVMGRTRQPSQRGVSLVDSGPVPTGAQVAPHDPVRRVSRQQHQRRSSSRNQLVSPISSNSGHIGSLPPGAAPPQY